MERNLFWKLDVICLFLFFTAGSLCADLELRESGGREEAGKFFSLEDYFLRYGQISEEEFLFQVPEDFSLDKLVVTPHEAVQDGSAFSESCKRYFPLIINKEVEEQIVYLTTKQRAFLIRAMERAENYIAEMRDIVRKYDLPEELVYLPIVESGFNYRAYSPKGAAGMWQFMLGTAKWIGMKRNEWVDERFDPIVSCEYAVKYLNMLYEMFQDWYLALAAYNYGGNNVKRAMMKTGSREFYDFVEKRIIPVETQKYVPRFVASVYIMKNPEKFGLRYTEKKHDLEYYSLPFTSPVRLVAKYAGMSANEFLKYNPALRSPFVPNNQLGYRIRLPRDNMELLKKNYGKLKEQSAMDYQVYYIRKGDSLSEIAYRYGLSMGILMNINGIRNSHRIREGQKLYIPVSYKAVYKNNVEKDKRTGNHHVVNWGDTISGIALKYNISADTLVKLNHLEDPYTIKVGQVLKIR